MTRLPKAIAAIAAALLLAPLLTALLIGLLAVVGYAVLVVLTFHEIHTPLREALGLEPENVRT